jgi:dTDP-4-dehydrorhamnose reductase
VRILVTGRDGQVARSLVERGTLAGHEVLALGRPQLDLANGPETIFAAIAPLRPEVIVSAAAYTAVDRAEAERANAFAINATGAGSLAMAASRLDVPLIHLSTDYVFDGLKADAYVETDVVGPTSIYGESKLAGERAVLAAHDDVAIVRTAWVFSPFGANFVNTMLRLAGEREQLSVVADQRGNPTSALDIADGIVTIAANLLSDKAADRRGIFHMTGSGEASWAEFAAEIMACSAALGGPSARVMAITTADFPTVARRPANSRLATDKLAAAHGVLLADWKASTRQTVERLVRADVTTGHEQ